MRIGVDMANPAAVGGKAEGQFTAQQLRARIGQNDVLRVRHAICSCAGNFSYLECKREKVRALAAKAWLRRALGGRGKVAYYAPAMKKYRDHYFLKAKQENYPARSVYKLKEIDKRFRIFKKGMRVLDLGAAPGSWSLGAAEKIGAEGFVLGCDIKATDTPFPANIIFMQEDVFKRSAAFEALLAEKGPFHVVMSDMAPSTTGHKGTDQARSAALTEEALAVALQWLARGGHFVVKVFMGPDTKALADAMRKHFAVVKSFKPASSRSESIETFYVGLGFKGLAQPDAVSAGHVADGQRPAGEN